MSAVTSSSPAVIDNTVVIGNEDGSVYCFGGNQNEIRGESNGCS